MLPGGLGSDSQSGTADSTARAGAGAGPTRLPESATFARQAGEATDHAALAATGLATVALTALGLVLIGLGATLVSVARRWEMPLA